MPEIVASVGDFIAAYLEACGVTHAYGVVSIHNMPILDAFGRGGLVHFVPARGEAGAMNMADAHARIAGGLGVCVTSTGTAAGNAAGGLVEALTAGSPVLHLTGQIDLPYLDRGCGFIHEAPDQPALLKAVSKAYFRVWTAQSAPGILAQAIVTALTPPMGPVSLEIPIDVQASTLRYDPARLLPLEPMKIPPIDAALERVAAMVAASRRPLFWLGGGCRGAEAAVARLAALGMPVITSVNGRGALPEDHPLSLGAFTQAEQVSSILRKADLLVVVGCRLRSNETKNYRLPWPRPAVQIDIDGARIGRALAVEDRIVGDAGLALTGLADRLEGRCLPLDPALAGEVRAARQEAEADLMQMLGPYARLVAMLEQAAPRDLRWVRDITISNSTWGNRFPKLQDSRAGVHALGGGVGQGVPMAIGAALAAQGRKTVCLTGDGGLALCMTELATAVQERADVAFLVMNDKGYGVIRNIQDAHYGARRYYTDITVPDLGKLACSMGLPHRKVTSLEAFPVALAQTLAIRGPAMLEVDMTAIGPFAAAFAGPSTGRPSSGDMT